MTPPPPDLTPQNDRERDLIARIRADEKAKAEASHLSTALSALRDEWRAGHADIVSRVDRIGDAYTGLEKRVDDMERDKREQEKRSALLVSRLRLDEWGADDLGNLLPSVQDYGARRRGSGKWKERVAIGAASATVIAVLLNIYLTIKGH